MVRSLPVYVTLLLMAPSVARQHQPFDVAAFERDRVLKAAKAYLSEAPNGYALFNLDAMATICRILSTQQEDLWAFELADGRGMRKAMEFMAPYIRNKKSWPLKPDVMYDQEWPMRHCSLLFAGQAFGKLDYIELWKTLNADSTVEEVIRNFFIRQPVVWL